IEVVGREAATREAGSKSRVLSYDLVAPADLSRREERLRRSEDALKQTIDLRDLKTTEGGDHAVGALLTDVQRLVSNKMRADVTLYINYDSFPEKVRPMLRDMKVKPGPIPDANGNVSTTAGVEAVLDHVLRPLGDHVKVRPTPDFLEIFWAGPPAKLEAAW